MTIGIVLDAWKLKFFTKAFKDAGYHFTKEKSTDHPGQGVFVIKVETATADEIKPIVQQAVLEAQQSRSTTH